MSWQVHLDGRGVAFAASGDETVLEAALRQGVPLPHECTFGGCGSCRCRLVRGEVRYDEMPLALTPEEAQAGYALACQARACSDLVLAWDEVDAPMPQRCEAVVRGTAPLAPDIVHLELDLQVDEVAYLPGQHMNVLLDDGAHRSFSMASPARGNRVDFHVRRVAGGRFTDAALARLAPGDRLQVEMPLGDFRLRAAGGEPVLLVATGTGIAPLRCMVEALLDEPSPPAVSLYWGMRTASDLYLADDVRRWRERLPALRFVPVLSRADARWDGRRGHVQDAVAADLPDLSGHAIHLCGSPAMIADAKRRFGALGASPDRIHADGFSFQREAVPA